MGFHNLLFFFSSCTHAGNSDVFIVIHFQKGQQKLAFYLLVILMDSCTASAVQYQIILLNLHMFLAILSLFALFESWAKLNCVFRVLFSSYLSCISALVSQVCLYCLHFPSKVIFFLP